MGNPTQNKREPAGHCSACVHRAPQPTPNSAQLASQPRPGLASSQSKQQGSLPQVRENQQGTTVKVLTPLPHQTIKSTEVTAHAHEAAPPGSRVEPAGLCSHAHKVAPPGSSEHGSPQKPGCLVLIPVWPETAGTTGNYPMCMHTRRSHPKSAPTRQVTTEALHIPMPAPTNLPKLRIHSLHRGHFYTSPLFQY